jgi:hypothetical protein
MFNSYANTMAGRARHYRLVVNIDLKGSNNWTAIGPSISASFTGSFDGGKHTISNLSVNRNADNLQGMFGIIRGEVKDLGLVNVSITGNDAVGGMAGMNIGMIQNCYTMGTVGGTTYVGGVVGYNGGTIRNTVALNPTVSAERRPIGRITAEMQGELTCNYAQDTMVVFLHSEGRDKMINPGLDTEDGASITSTQWNTASWWTNAANWYTANGNLAWDTSVWDIASGRLPLLQNSVVRKP